jgi:hypothetical protein
MKVTKRSTFTGDLNVSEQSVEHSSGEPGSLSAGPAASPSPEAISPQASASVHEPAKEISDIGSPDLVPEQGTAADAPKADAAKPEAPKVEASRPEAPRGPGKVLIMSAGDHHHWEDRATGMDTETEPGQGMFGKRRLSALAAVVALAAVAGALGGAMATAGLSHFTTPAVASTPPDNSALEASVARIDADILALKANVEHSSKASITQFNKTNDRLDKVEKAQAEPAAKLAKLSDAVDKLRATPAPQAAPVPVAAAPAPKEVTGSVTPQANAPAAPPKAEVARLPTVEGWALRDVDHGSALIDGRQGAFEVYAGDTVPGLGRIDAIRKQDGRWVVVTSRGLIVAR